MNYEFVDDVKANKNWKHELLKLVENSTLENWILSKGGREPDYKYLGLVRNGKLIAAIGALQTSLFLHNEVHPAVQLGNFFFIKDFHFSRLDQYRAEHKLLAEVVKKYSTLTEVIYTYRQESAENLMNEVGLKKSQEFDYFLDVSNLPRTRTRHNRFNLTDSNKIQLGAEIRHANLLKASCDLRHDGVIREYNVLKYYADNVFEVPSLDSKVILERKGDVCKIIGIFCKRKVDLIQLIKAVVPKDVKTVEFGFMPPIEMKGLIKKPRPMQTYDKNKFGSSQLYLKIIDIKLNDEGIMFPLLSRHK